jgi:hypothetical protein
VVSLDGETPIPEDGSGVPIDLTDDGQQPGETSRNWMMEVRVRTRTGYDDDGNPMWDWTTLVTGSTILHEERTEFDDDAGFTVVKAVATILYGGQTVVPETAVVVREDGVRYAVDSVSQVGTNLTLDMHRMVGEYVTPVVTPTVEEPIVEPVIP